MTPWFIVIHYTPKPVILACILYVAAPYAPHDHRPGIYDSAYLWGVAFTLGWVVVGVWAIVWWAGQTRLAVTEMADVPRPLFVTLLIGTAAALAILGVPVLRSSVPWVLRNLRP